MIRTTLLAGAALALFPAAALAQTAPATPATAAKTPTVGATVLDSNGATIGTVVSITPQAIVLDVSGTKIAVPPAAIGSTPKGFAMAMTKEALQAAQAQQQAAAQAAVKSRLVAGAPVAGLNGAPVGTIKSTSNDMVTLTTSKGEVTLPASGFTANATGQLIIGLTQAQLDAAISGNGGATTSTATGGDTAASGTATDAEATSTSTGIDATGGTTGTATMTPPATPATTTAPAPEAKPMTPMKKSTRKPK
jgi:hypothetical protein